MYNLCSKFFNFAMINCVRIWLEIEIFMLIVYKKAKIKNDMDIDKYYIYIVQQTKLSFVKPAIF